MCAKMKLIAVLLNLLHYFTVGFNVTKLAILSTAKHLKYSIKYTDLGMEFKRHTESITNVQFPSNFHRMSPNMYLW